MMPFAKPVTTIAAFFFATQSFSAAAQAPAAVPPAAPDAWTATPSADQSSVRISKTASDGTTVFVGGCDKRLGPGFIGSFLRYRGDGLQTIDGQTERVLFQVHGAEWKEAFAVQLRYSARNRSWEIARAIAPVFVGSFARGAKLTVLNSAREEVLSLDLTGSSNAASVMRSVCGF